MIDLLIACRRRNSSPPKLRPDYYRRTLETARARDDEEDEEEDEEASLSSEIKVDGVVPVLPAVLEDRESFAKDGGGVLHRYCGGRYLPTAGWVGREVREILEDGAATREWRDSIPSQLTNYIGVFAPQLWDRPPPETINVRNGLVDVAEGALKPHATTHLTSVQFLALRPRRQLPAD